MYSGQSARFLGYVDVFRFQTAEEERELDQTVEGGLSGYLVTETPEHYWIWVRLLSPVWGEVN